MTGLATPQQVMARLQAIEHDLAERQNDYEEAASNRARLLRDWEYRLQLHMKQAGGSNESKRKANAFVAAVEQDDLYEHLTEAEAAYDAHSVVVDKVLARRATIGQSILKAQGRG